MKKHERLREKKNLTRDTLYSLREPFCYINNVNSIFSTTKNNTEFEVIGYFMLMLIMNLKVRKFIFRLL